VLRAKDELVKPIRLGEAENVLVVGAVLAGKLGYLGWSAIGDDLNVSASASMLGRIIALKAKETLDLAELGRDVMEIGKSAAFVSKNNDGYINIRWSNVRSTTDTFDRELLETVGLISEWRALNIWYRQTMGSTRDNLNSRYLTRTEADSHLALP
jgi:hypothetical protein